MFIYLNTALSACCLDGGFDTRLLRIKHVRKQTIECCDQSTQSNERSV